MLIFELVSNLMWQTVRERTIFRTAWYFFKIRWKSANSTEFNSATFFEVISGENLSPEKGFWIFLRLSHPCSDIPFYFKMTWVLSNSILTIEALFHWLSAEETSNYCFFKKEVKHLSIRKYSKKEILQINNSESNPNLSESIGPACTTNSATLTTKT